MRNRALFTMLAAVLLVPAAQPLAAAAADDAAAVLARHAAYVGQPPGLVLTYRYESAGTPTAAPAATGEDAAFPAPLQTSYRRGPLHRDVTSFSGVTQQNGFTGRAFWSANENGYTVVERDDTARYRLTENLVDGDLLSTAGVEARSRGAREVDGVATDVVRITPPGGIPAEVAFDHATGAYVEITYDPDNRYERSVVHVDGYTEAAPGIRVPSGYHAGRYGKWRLSEHAVRVPGNDELNGPAPSATWTFAPGDSVPIEVVEHQTPYAFQPRGQAVHVRASLNGHPGTFLLDSGASNVVVYRPYADKLGLTMLGKSGFSGINGGFVAARFARAGSLTVGKSTLSNVVVRVAKGDFGEGIDGILGYDFLAGALVDVDTANGTLQLLDPAAFQPTVGPGAYAFPLDLATLTPEIALRVGHTATRAVIDSGDDFLMVLSDDLKTSHRLISLDDSISLGGRAAMDYTISFYGVDGPANVPARCSRLNEIAVGPYRYENVETCFASAKVFGADGGLIGFDFLRHFNWTFDYPEAKLVLTPNGK